MDCRQALSQLADHSATALSPAQTQTLVEHLQKCPECENEWKAFEKTLFRLSTSPQALPSDEQSRRIWAACLEEISQGVERRRNPSFLSRFAPNWSWAALGGAAAVFGAVYFLTPQTATTSVSSPSVSTSAPRAQFARFQTPPEPMTALVDHHAAMSFDAFNDHTASTLVSYRSTAPISSP